MFQMFRNAHEVLAQLYRTEQEGKPATRSMEQATGGESGESGDVEDSERISSFLLLVAMASNLLAMASDLVALVLDTRE